MVEPIRLAVFDVAGTTVLDGDAVVDSMQDALGRRRVEVPRQEIVALMGLPKPQAITMLFGKHSRLNGGSLRPLADRVLDDFLAGVKQRYRDGPGIAPAEDALEVFAALRRAGITVALDTGFSREVLDVLLQRLGWQNGDPIDLTVASDEGARGRPFPDLIRIAMTRAQVLSPQAVVKIGDTPADLAQGLAAHCGLVVGVTYGTHVRQQLERPGVHVIDRLVELLPLVNVEVIGR